MYSQNNSFNQKTTPALIVGCQPLQTEYFKNKMFKVFQFQILQVSEPTVGIEFGVTTADPLQMYSDENYNQFQKGYTNTNK